MNEEKRVVIRKNEENDTIKELKRQLEENTKTINKLSKKLKKIIKH